MSIPVIDLFAGPGGLGEGFSSVYDDTGNREFKVALSIEYEHFAHQTLELRSFFRQFPKNNITDDYYQFLRQEIDRERLFNLHKEEAIAAQAEAWNVKLGTDGKSVARDELDKRIRKALNNAKTWILIGGPPCQAYSIVGRARTGGINPNDERVYLYREYYRILAVHNPPFFIMENVKGLLSSKVEDRSLFKVILEDLSNPVKGYEKLLGNEKLNLSCPGYSIFSLVKNVKSYRFETSKIFNPYDFVIKSEEYGIPQSRHRIILLGIRKDLNILKIPLLAKVDSVPVKDIIAGLPKIRSCFSKGEDNKTKWKNYIHKIKSNGIFDLASNGSLFSKSSTLNKEDHDIPELDTGKEFIPCSPSVKFGSNWYLDKKIGGVCNHSSRSHLEDDIARYFYAAYFAKFQQVPDPRQTILP